MCVYVCMYVYIYISWPALGGVDRSARGVQRVPRGGCRQVGGIYDLAQDKGGPSKGGFLKNRLLSYTDIYIYMYMRVMKLMVCVNKRYIIQDNNRLFRKPPLLGPPLSLPE